MSHVAYWPETSLSALDVPPIGQVRETSRTGAAAETEGRLLQLIQAMEEAGVQGWDGEGARPASPSACAQAARFLVALPETWPSPEIAIERDGSVNLEWGHSANYVFTISVNASGVLHYAGLYGDSKTHGAEAFVGEIPRVVVDNLHRLEIAARAAAAA